VIYVKNNMFTFTRKKLQKSGKDHSILFVLPSGIYHYKVIVDGESKYIPDLPFVADEVGNVCNILDVHVSYFPTSFFLMLNLSISLTVSAIIMHAELCARKPRKHSGV